MHLFGAPPVASTSSPNKKQARFTHTIAPTLRIRASDPNPRAPPISPVRYPPCRPVNPRSWRRKRAGGARPLARPCQNCSMRRPSNVIVREWPPRVGTGFILFRPRSAHILPKQRTLVGSRQHAPRTDCLVLATRRYLACPNGGSRQPPRGMARCGSQESASRQRILDLGLF